MAIENKIYRMFKKEIDFEKTMGLTPINTIKYYIYNILVCSFIIFLFLTNVYGMEAEVFQSTEQPSKQDQFIAEKVLFRYSLTQVKLLDPSITIFICYDFEDNDVYTKIASLVEDLVALSIPENQIFWRNVAGSENSIYQYAAKLFETSKVFVVGSHGLKEKYEGEKAERGIISHQIENLLTRKLKKGPKGIIPIWFEGGVQESLPVDLCSLEPHHLGEDYFINFFDLLLDIDGDTKSNNSIAEAKENFIESRRILEPEFIFEHAVKLRQYQQETDKKNKLNFEKFLTEQLILNKPATRYWITNLIKNIFKINTYLGGVAIGGYGGSILYQYYYNKEREINPCSPIDLAFPHWLSPDTYDRCERYRYLSNYGPYSDRWSMLAFFGPMLISCSLIYIYNENMINSCNKFINSKYYRIGPVPTRGEYLQVITLGLLGVGGVYAVCAIYLIAMFLYDPPPLHELIFNYAYESIKNYCVI